MEKLLVAFGTEMNILHEVTLEQLMEIVPEKLAGYIDSARKGTLSFEVGGGGKYGRLKRKANLTKKVLTEKCELSGLFLVCCFCIN